MAYRNLVLQSCLSKAEVFARMRDFLCARIGTYDYSTSGIGWTLHDSSYAVDEDNPDIGDWVVFYSSGENTKERMYFQLNWVDGYLSINGFLYWDAVAHAGVSPYQTSTTTMICAEGLTAYDLSVYGDLDGVVVIEKLGYTGGPQKLIFGKLAGTLYDSTPNISATAATAGAGVVVTLDNIPADWGPGKSVFVLDNAKVNIETITSISGLDVTLDLANSYDAGFSMQGDIGYFAGNSLSTPAVDLLISHSGVTDQYMSTTVLATYASQYPDNLDSEYAAGRHYQYSANTQGGYVPHIVSVSTTGLVTEDLLIGTPNSYRYFDMYTTDFAVKEV